MFGESARDPGEGRFVERSGQIDAERLGAERLAERAQLRMVVMADPPDFIDGVWAWCCGGGNWWAAARSLTSVMLAQASIPSRRRGPSRSPPRLAFAKATSDAPPHLDTPTPMPLHRATTTRREDMAQKSKQVGSFREAVQDIPDGATIGFGGFAMLGCRSISSGGGGPRRQGAHPGRNTTGGATCRARPDIGMLVENGQVKKVICAFTAPTRPTDVIPFTNITSPAWSMPEWCHRARWPNGCAPQAPAFRRSTPRPRSAPNSPQGRDTRVINGRDTC